MFVEAAERLKGIVTPDMVMAVSNARKEASLFADARVPSAGHRHLQTVPTYEQAVLIAKVERLKARARLER